MQVFVETERLVLRRFTEADVDNLFDLDSDPDVMRFLTGGRPTSRDVIRNETLPRFLHYYECFAGFGFWAAIEKPTGQFLGWLEFRPPEGSGPDKVELGVRRVVASTMTVNIASRRVMEKAGLTLERTFHQEWPDRIEGAEQGDVEYALRKVYWEQQEAAGGERLPEQFG